jgi:hypothetical protein
VLGLLIFCFWFVLPVVAGICFAQLFYAPASWVHEITDGLLFYCIFLSLSLLGACSLLLVLYRCIIGLLVYQLVYLFGLYNSNI